MALGKALDGARSEPLKHKIEAVHLLKDIQSSARLRLKQWEQGDATQQETKGQDSPC